MRLKKNAAFSRASLAAAVALMLLGLLLWSLPQEAPPSPILAEKEGWQMEKGAPLPEGEPVFLSRESLLQGTLLLISPENPLPYDFPAPNTRDIRRMVGAYLPVREGTMLHEDAIYALCTMQFEFPLEHGITFIRGALSHAQQEEWRRAAFDRFIQVYSLQEALEKTMQTIPGGGESEHQTGYCMDLIMTGILRLSGQDPLQYNETGQWLKENLWKHGWIRRFESMEAGCESVHIRYVGKAHAAALQLLETDLESYLSLLRREGSITLQRDGEIYCHIYCFPCTNSCYFPLPENARYEASADNTGWAVITLFP